MTVTPTSPAGSGQLELLKALGDNTRFAIYEHLASASRPLTTAEIAALLQLHPNTVRPHLERMRDVGLIDVSIDGRGEVGRPHHRYSIATVTPSLGFEPSGVAELADLALAMARRLGASSDDAYEVGYQRGARRAQHYGTAPSTLEALVDDLGRLGFQPTVEEADDHETAIVSFGRCPFQAQVDEYPDLICTLHHGIVSGLVREMGDARVIEFCDRSHRTPCRVAVGER
ncbi:MAG: helix-turn-helix domain-containing protein [Acidimicrobiia bacterium]|nr:helix-turn-helix domain-containing protein [Acidimicrobiia bacterium]